MGAGGVARWSRKTQATGATGFEVAFPGLDLRLLTLALNFYIPFTREARLLGARLSKIQHPKLCYG